MNGTPAGPAQPAAPTGAAAPAMPTVSAKPTVAELGIDAAAQDWERSGTGDSDGGGSIEIAFVTAAGQEWVLMRTADDPDGRVLVYDRHEWECFLDGAKNGEFDDATG